MTGGFDETVRSNGPTDASGTGSTVADPLGETIQPEPADLPSAFDGFDPATSPFVRRGVLGRGGMGQVIVAHDRRLGRSVAIKELNHATDAARARFEREVRLAARLQHPNIVPVYEAGRSATGEPYYTMRPVAGQTLTKAIDRATGRAERIALVPRVLAVAEAIAFAHKNGVIHRDLKPTNILIGEFGETLVIDWGLAKRIDESSDDAGLPASGESIDLTRHGSVMGTPSYMPPEQAQGATLDERADVYAIGAILYHVLAGVAPYHGARSADELLAQVKAGPPLALATVATELPADLVAIVERAMARAPADRYPDARGLADDLGRFATGRLVSAHAYSIRQLVRRWLARHRVAIGVAVAAAVALAAIGVYSVVRIRNERTTAVRERAVAVERQHDVEGLLDFMLGDLHSRLQKSGDLAALGGSTARIADYFARHPVAPGDRAGIRRRAALDVELSEVSEARGDLAAAEATLRAALALAEPAAAADPTDGELGETVHQALVALGDIQLQRGQPAEAMTTIARALAYAQTRSAGGDVEWRRAVASDLFNRARGQLAMSSPEAARADLEDALARFRAVATDAPDNRVVQRDIARVLGKLATMASAARDPRRARELAAEAALVFERLAGDEPDQVLERVDLAHALGMLARYQTATGERGAAHQTLERARVLTERLLVDDPSRLEHTQTLAIILGELAGGSRADHDYQAALALERRALDLLVHLTEVDPAKQLWQQNVAEMHDQLAATLRESGDRRAALAEYEPAFAIRRAMIAAAPDATEVVLDLANDLDQASALHRDLGDHAQAARVAMEAATTREPVLAAHPDNREAHIRAALSYERAGDEQVAAHQSAAAATSYDRGTAIIDGFRARSGADDPELAQVAREIADQRANCCGPP